MSARDDILGKLRRTLANEPVAPEPPREYRQSADTPREEIISDFVQKLEDYTAVVTRTDAAGVPDAIAAFLNGLGSVVVPHGLPDEWKEAAERDGRSVRLDSRKEPLSHAELDATDAVVTGSRVGISLSGTIILDGEPDQGRRAITLVPDTHVVVLREDDVFPTVPQAVAVLGQHPTRPTTWIAGPSATSDIELVRVDGVHGPRNLRVVLYR